MAGQNRRAGDPPVTIAIFGSANIDIVATVTSLPNLGQTVHAVNRQINVGGKGANQAVAAKAFYRGEVRLIAAVGADAFGEMFMQRIERFGLKTDQIAVREDSETGIALIHVDAAGNNAITVFGGANMAWPASGPAAADFEAVKIALFQLETPIESTMAALQKAKAAQALTILDPAPVPESGLGDMLRFVDVITPNQHEAEALVGERIASPEDAIAVAARLCALGPETAIVTLGAQGVAFCDGKAGQGFAPACSVNAVDTVAAGDCFNGALAAGLAEGMAFRAALSFANAASALSVTRAGAADSIPSRLEVEAFLSSGRAV